MLRHRCFFGVKSALTALTVFVCLILAPALIAAETEESLPLKASGLFQIGKLTVIPPGTNANRGRIRTGLMTPGLYRTSLPEPL